MTCLTSRWRLFTTCLILLSVNSVSWSEEPHDHIMNHEHTMNHDNAMQHDHSAHMKMMASPDFTVSDVSYVIPQETLMDTSGNKVELEKLLNLDRPIALNFIFTTCTTICPVMTATFAQMRRELGELSSKVQLVSITIDPEYDRPAVLKEYAARFGASEGWSFLTGEGNSINKVLRSFNVFAGSKMNHQPITLFKNPKSKTWVRVDGLASGHEMASLIKKRLLN